MCLLTWYANIRSYDTKEWKVLSHFWTNFNLFILYIKVREEITFWLFFCCGFTVNVLKMQWLPKNGFGLKIEMDEELYLLNRRLKRHVWVSCSRVSETKVLKLQFVLSWHDDELIKNKTNSVDCISQSQKLNLWCHPFSVKLSFLSLLYNFTLYWIQDVKGGKSLLLK